MYVCQQRVVSGTPRQTHASEIAGTITRALFRAAGTWTDGVDPISKKTDQYSRVGI